MAELGPCSGDSGAGSHRTWILSGPTAYLPARRWSVLSSSANKHKLVRPAAQNPREPGTLRVGDDTHTAVPQMRGVFASPCQSSFMPTLIPRSLLKNWAILTATHQGWLTAASELRVLDQALLPAPLCALFPSLYVQKLTVYYLLQSVKQLLHSKTSLASPRHQKPAKSCKVWFIAPFFWYTVWGSQEWIILLGIKAPKALYPSNSQHEATGLDILLLDFGTAVSHQG